MFSLQQNREDDCLELISKVYDDSENKYEILEALKAQVAKKSVSKMSFCKSVCGRKYRYGTLVALGITSLT